MRISKYIIETEKKGIDVRLAVVSDLHARPYNAVIDAVKRIGPDVILLPGDIVEIAAPYMDKRNQNGLNFLKEIVSIAPVYYCYGNHELYYSHAKCGKSKRPDPTLANAYSQRIVEFGVHLINDCFEPCKNRRQETDAAPLYVGGLVCGRDMDPDLSQKDPDLHFLKEYEKAKGYKILLCHYPHYYEKYLKNTAFDLILSGHAHGGQWRFFGRGIYAPHQGLFPKYTSGMHDGRHIISTGAVNNAKPIPRFFNSPEVLEIHIISKQE